MKRMPRGLIAAGLTAAVVASALALGAPAANAAQGDQVLYTDAPTATQGAQYTHAITLRHNGAANGTVLASFERFDNTDGDKPSFPVYRSTNFGASWSAVTNINDAQFGVGNRWQPSLYELPEASGNLPRGTILLAGNAVPNDLSTTRLVLYKSTDAGNTWSFVSTIDTGGDGRYDPSPSSTRTPVWEPELELTPSGLVAYFSDERAKDRGVLQGIVHRVSTDGGRTWGPVVDDVMPPDRNARPGMMSVTRLPNGKYLGVYEVVNVDNSVPVYAKISDDGVNWPNPTQLGTRIQTANNQWMNGSPSVEWVPTGGPNGTIILTGGWLQNSDPNQSNFLANTNLGVGDWTLFPAPVDSAQTLSGYSETVTPSLDYRYLMHLTSTASGLANNRNNVVSSVMPLDTTTYQAEAQQVTGAQILNRSAASGGKEVGFINDAGSNVLFTVNAPRAGDYKVRIRYSNGSGTNATHSLTVNGAGAAPVSYTPTRNWDQYDFATVTVRLAQGANTLRFGRANSFAELDAIELYTQGARYEAENAALTNATRFTRIGGSAGQHAGNINFGDSAVDFSAVNAEAAGNYAVRITYSNGTATTSSHRLSVNGASPIEVSLPSTGAWDRERTAFVIVPLQAGLNSLRFTKGTGFAELDAIDVY